MVREVLVHHPSKIKIKRPRNKLSKINQWYSFLSIKEIQSKVKELICYDLPVLTTHESPTTSDIKFFISI